MVMWPAKKRIIPMSLVTWIMSQTILRFFLSRVTVMLRVGAAT